MNYETIVLTYLRSRITRYLECMKVRDFGGADYDDFAQRLNALISRPDIGIEQLETVLDEIRDVDEHLAEYQDYWRVSPKHWTGFLLWLHRNRRSASLRSCDRPALKPCLRSK